MVAASDEPWAAPRPRPRGSTAAWCCEMASRTTRTPGRVDRPGGGPPVRAVADDPGLSELGADHPGALVEALTSFPADVSLTRIESRPLRQGLGRPCSSATSGAGSATPRSPRDRGARGRPSRSNPGQLSDRGERRAWDLRPAATALGPDRTDLCLQSWRYGQGGGRPHVGLRSAGTRSPGSLPTSTDTLTERP
jgi:hypothetical protein